MTTVSKHHPTLVVLHWLSAALIIGALALGALVMADIPNSDPKKLEALRAHMAGGLLIGLLTILRLAIRARTSRPPPATTGAVILDRLAWLSHRLFYVLVLAQVATGLIMALQARLPQILFLGAPGHLPTSFWMFEVRGWHYVVSRLLIGLIALHVAAVGYHQFVRQDRLIARMTFGKRRLAAPPEEPAAAAH